MSKPSIDLHENTFAAVFDLIGCQHIFRLSKRLIQILMQSFWRQYFTVWHDRSVVNHDITAIVLATTPYKIAGSVGGRYVAILEISVASRLHFIGRNFRSVCQVNISVLTQFFQRRFRVLNISVVHVNFDSLLFQIIPQVIILSARLE